MRKIIAAVVLCVVSALAHADNYFAYSINKNNGRIELSFAPVPDSVVRLVESCGNAHIAKSWGGDGKDIYGCWRPAGDTIVIVWILDTGNEEHTYPMAAFTPYKKNQ